jgi:hypothetical protein
VQYPALFANLDCPFLHIFQPKNCGTAVFPPAGAQLFLCTAMNNKKRGGGGASSGLWRVIGTLDALLTGSEMLGKGFPG